MNRLTRKQSDGYSLESLNGELCNVYCEKQEAGTCNECGIHEAVQKLAQYEDLQEQSRLVVLPCEIGARVYRIVPDLSVVYPDPPEYRVIWDTFKLQDVNKFGKMVFLSEEEALKKVEDKYNLER